MYADDLILISASLCNLQSLIGICIEKLESISLDMTLKVK